MVVAPPIQRWLLGFNVATRSHILLVVFTTNSINISPSSGLLGTEMKVKFVPKQGERVLLTSGSSTCRGLGKSTESSRTGNASTWVKHKFHSAGDDRNGGRIGERKMRPYGRGLRTQTGPYLTA